VQNKKNEGSKQSAKVVSSKIPGKFQDKTYKHEASNKENKVDSNSRVRIAENSKIRDQKKVLRKHSFMEPIVGK
jgi:hypothetical protein